MKHTENSVLLLLGGDIINKREKELFQWQLDHEKAVLKQLEKQYKTALEEINDKILLLQSRTVYDSDGIGRNEQLPLNMLPQSRIYQIEHQKALKGQIEAILERLHGDEYETIQQYLEDSYVDSFVGTAYDLAGQGIPLIMPIDQAAAVRAIQTDSKISEGLYESLGVDTKALKKAISREATRGIASGLTYQDIARNIQNVAKAPLRNAHRIARTEGHRIQQASALDAQKAAKVKGADVVKQWDSSLDGRVRKNHRKLDGQIREVDEPFEVDGKKAMFPGDFGRPEEDINCRCASLTRARWGLDEDELQTLKDRAEYFGLDKTKDFKGFKKKYLDSNKKQSEGVAESWIKTGDLPPSMNEFDDWDDYKKAMNSYDGSQKYVSDSEWNNHHVYDETEMRNAKRFDATIAQLQEKYPPSVNTKRLIIGDYENVQHNLNAIQRSRIGDEATAQHWINSDTNTSVIGFRPNQTTTTFGEDLLKRQKAIDNGDVLSEVFYNSAEGTAIHEYGHEMSEYLSKGMVYDDPDAKAYWNWYKSLDKEDIRQGLSDYAATNRMEFEAECFAELQTSNPRPIAKKYGEYLEKLMKKNYDTSDEAIARHDAQQKLARKIDTSSIKTVILPKKEYAHVMSEIATHMSDRQKEQSIVTKAIGKYVYTFENHGFGDYRIIAKKPIDEDVSEWWGD